MKRFMLTLALSALLSAYSTYLFPVESNSADLSVINDSDSTVLIMFTRHMGAAQRAKLLESGEAIDFGRVYEASVQSYSTLWGYIAPAKQVLFSARLLKSGGHVDDIAVCIKGISGRGIFEPFGHWDYDLIVGKKLVDLAPHYCHVDSAVTVLDAFPTAKRKIMYTPRYILGLPQYASFDDALEASLMLECKWRTHYAEVPGMTQKLTSNVIYIIDESRKAFQHGQADVPLHIPVEMRSPLPCASQEDDPEALAWS